MLESVSTLPVPLDATTVLTRPVLWTAIRARTVQAPYVATTVATVQELLTAMVEATANSTLVNQLWVRNKTGFY